MKYKSDTVRHCVAILFLRLLRSCFGFASQSLAMTMVLFSFFISTSYAEEITLLVTGDTHAMIYPCSCPVEPDGGVSRRATFINAERQKTRNLLLVDSGAFVGGGILDDYSQNALLDKERTVINLKALELMKYDALGLSDDEFNFGEEFLAGHIQPGKSNFLSCNITAKDSRGTPAGGIPAFVQPYIIKEIAGIKIGILGATPPQANVKAQNVKITEPKAAVSRYVGELRKQPVDMVILLSNLGENEDRKLAAEVTGIDIIISGHNSQNQEPSGRMGNSFIIRPDRQGRKMTKAVAVIKNKRIADIKTEQIRLSDKIADDPEIRSILPQCFYDYTCSKSGMIGKCVNVGTSNARCEFTPGHKVSLEIIRPKDCATCVNSIANGIQYLRRYFPGLTVSYTVFPGAKAQATMQKLGAKTLPLYLLGREIEKEEVFGTIADKFELRNNMYILKPGIGGISFYSDRKNIKGKLALFISLFDAGAKEVLAILKPYNPEVHFLATEQNNVFAAAKGNLEVEEYLRCACVQKYYPQNFWDYVSCRAGNPNSSWWEDCTGSMDTSKIKICAHGSEGTALLGENIKLNRELQVMFGPAYLKDNQEIFASRGAPDKEELLKIIGKNK